MNLKTTVLSLSAAMLLSGGCLGPSIDYQGQELTPSQTVKVIKKAGQLADYKSIGTACTSGGYTDYTYDELLHALVKKAAKVGADAVYVTSYEVVPVDLARDDQITNYSPVNGRINDRDVNILEKQISDPNSRIGVKPSNSNDPSVYTYKRIVKADFLKKK